MQVKLYADDMAGAFCRNKRSIAFFARGYDNYMKRTGLFMQHELTFYRTRDANRFVEWLAKCQQAYFNN
jgi:hypothetical protein